MNTKIHAIKQAGVFLAVILLLFTLLMLPGCSSLGTASEVADQFMSAMESGDYAAAHEHIWARAGRVSQETFVANATAIYEGLGATGISFPSHEVVREGDNVVFRYTIAYAHGEDFTVTNEASLYMLFEEGQYYIQYSDDMLLKGFTKGSRVVRSTLKGSRGEIFTADREPVAINSYSDTVAIHVSSDLNANSTINAIAAITGMDDEQMVEVREDYNSAIEHNYGTVIAYVYPIGQLTDETRASLEAIPGVFIDSDSLTPQRYYPHGAIYAHIVGYASSPNEEQLEALTDAGFADATLVGKVGIEAEYDSYLQPKSGYIYRLYDADGVYQRTLYEQPAQNGADITLTVNHATQEKSYYLMISELTSSQTGVSIVMDPSTGFVESMLSMPSYDPNIFSFPVSDADYAALTDSASKQPLYNRITSGLYPPGSIIKPFTVTPALENGIVTRYTPFPYKVSDNKWEPDGVWYWDPVTRNEAPDTDTLDLDAAIRFSDNIYFSWVTLKMGEDLFMPYMEKIGLGQAVPFDLPTSTSNLLNVSTELNRKMLSDLSFGHGEMLVTPIQAASMYTVFQNDGDILAPKLVLKISRYHADNTEEILYQAEREVYIEDAMDPETVDILTYSLKNVVKSGTAQSLQTKGLTLAAKTGTALKGDDKTKKIAWIAAWYQDMDADRLTVVMIEGPRAQNDRRHAVAKALLQPAK